MGKHRDFDVVVIGAGIAGLVSAVTANGLGQRVAIIEKRRFGGNCGSYTCLPSKTIIRAGHVNRLLHRLNRFGLCNTEPANIDTANLMSHVRSVVQKAYEKDVPVTFERIGITTIDGEAAFIDNHHVKVNENLVSSNKFIIAAGTRPIIPPINGLQDVNYLTNESLFELNKLPKSITILGGGVDGLEFASAFGRLGIEVTVVEMAPRLLLGDDRELVNQLLEHLQYEGIKLLTGTRATSVSRDGDHIILTIERSNGKSDIILADALLLTIGRKSDLESLNLDNTNVKYTQRGIQTNTKMQTTVPTIYACGDIVGPYQLASIAEYQGIIAATNAVLPLKQKVDYSNAVFVIFTEPILAHVGFTEEQARKKHGNDITVYRFDYKKMRRALVDGNEVGLAKLICDGRGKLLGAHILGEGASDVIHEAQILKVFKIPLYKVQQATHAYPTYAQAVIGRAGQLAYLDHMNSRFFVRQFLKFFPGYSNRLLTAKQRLAEAEEIAPAISKDEPVLDITMKAHEPFGKEITVKAMSLEHNVCLIELPLDLIDPDEEPYSNVCTPQPSTRNHYVILDFSMVQIINGLGATMLVKLSTQVRRRGQRLLAIGVNDHYRDVLKVTGLDRALAIFDSREEACAFAQVSCSKLPSQQIQRGTAQDIECWSKPVNRLQVPLMPPEAINLNIKGRHIVGPVNGFGQLWQKKYQLKINKSGMTPEDLILILKQNFPSFQPSYNRFYPTEKGIAPGEMVAIDSLTPGGPVSTGVLVLYSDDRSFTFITPQGHPESGWVTFSAFEVDDTVVFQILGLARANDPIYEAAFHTVGSKMQVKVWTHVITSLAMYLGIPADISIEPICLDKRMQWSEIGNVWHNAQVRTMLYMPLHILKRATRGKAK